MLFRLGCFARSRDISKPLGKSEVKHFLKRLNKQKILVTYDKSLSKDKIVQYEPINNSFMLEGSSSAQYFLYKADINNDQTDEYILCVVDGSGSFFDIEAIYKGKDGKLVDILNQIKKPMNKIVEVAIKGDQDLLAGYCGFMNGSIIIEEENGKVFFTLERGVRDYDAKGLQFNPPEGFKVLWEKGEVKLLEHYVGDKVYKIENKYKHPIDKFLEECEDKDYTTTGITSCLRKAEKKWDAELNKYYKLLMGILDKESKEKLRQAQLSWIKFRDAEAENAYSLYLLKEGTAYQNIAAAEVMTITEERALKLKAYYDLLMEDKK